MTNVDMEQEMADAGVDGVSILSTDWDSTYELDFDAQEVQEARAKAVEGATFHWGCCYD